MSPEQNVQHLNALVREIGAERDAWRDALRSLADPEDRNLQPQEIADRLRYRVRRGA